MTLQIRPMTETDLATAIGWAAAEGWNPGLADAGPFRAEDAQGFLMGWLGDQPVASISVIRPCSPHRDFARRAGFSAGP